MFRRLKSPQAILDVFIAVAVFLFIANLNDSAGLAGGVLAVGFAAAIGFRRFSPAVALTLAWLTALFQMYVADLLPSWPDLAILGVIYATAAYGSRTVRWLGFASIFVGAVSGAAFVENHSRDFVLSLHLSVANLAEVGRFLVGLTLYGILIIVILGLPWTAGNLVRTRIAARESRQAQAVAESDAEGAERDMIVEQERNRIARDMHDVVAHSLAIVIAQADGARYAQKFDPGAVDGALKDISSTAREALADVRLLLGQLRHSQNEGPQPALADLGRLLDQLRASGLIIGFDATGTPLPLGTSQQLAVYRIVQEALTNALRHGDPEREVAVHFEWTPDDLEVTIQSTLTSSPATSELRVGHGLAGMRERAALVGGRLTTEVAPPLFIVRAFIPASASVPK